MPLPLLICVWHVPLSEPHPPGLATQKTHGERRDGAQQHGISLASVRSQVRVPVPSTLKREKEKLQRGPAKKPVLQAQKSVKDPKMERPASQAGQRLDSCTSCDSPPCPFPGRPLGAMLLNALAGCLCLPSTCHPRALLHGYALTAMSGAENKRGSRVGGQICHLVV